MWEKILSIFASLIGMWTKLPEETKDKIIDSIVDMFTDIFRQQYNSTKNDEGKDGETA